MRARIAIFKARQQVELRDVILSNKPAEMIAVSPKGTVPVLVVDQSSVIDESLDIMLWALGKSDPDDLLQSRDSSALPNMLKLITVFDNEFKVCLEKYKCAKRYHENTVAECRQACEVYLQALEQGLNEHDFIFSEKESLVDLALLSFIRQFARVERQWYLQSPYPKLRQWLNSYLQSPMFTKVMSKYPLWQENQEAVFFGKG